MLSLSKDQMKNRGNISVFLIISVILLSIRRSHSMESNKRRVYNNVDAQKEKNSEKCYLKESDRAECPSEVVNDRGNVLEGWIYEEWMKAFERVSQQMDQLAKVKPSREDVPEFLHDIYERNNLFA